MIPTAMWTNHSSRRRALLDVNGGGRIESGDKRISIARPSCCQSRTKTPLKNPQFDFLFSSTVIRNKTLPGE